MAKIIASFDQENADAVVAVLSRMDVDGLKWRVDDNTNTSDSSTGAVPAAIPASVTGNGPQAVGSGSPLVAPFLAGESDGLGVAGDDDEAAFLRQARRGGATVIMVDTPREAEAIVRDLFERHSGSNIVVK